MKLLVLLKKKDLDVSRREACVVFDTQPFIEQQDLLIVDTSRPHLISRLSQSRLVGAFILDAPCKTFLDEFSRVEWEERCTGSYAIRSDGLRCCDERTLASAVWSQLDSPRVDLKDPDTEIIAVERNKICVAGITRWVQRDTGRGRRADQRPFLYPASLDPLLARLMVNMTGIDSGTIYDPFCGSGGILIEAGLMGLAIKGSDIDEAMTLGCVKNLAHAGLVEQDIRVQDARRLSSDVDYVVTDLPYMKNTKGNAGDLDSLYREFFRYLGKHLRKRAVIGIPNQTDVTGYLDSLGVLYSFSWYIHRSLTKNIMVLAPKKIYRTSETR